MIYNRIAFKHIQINVSPKDNIGLHSDLLSFTLGFPFISRVIYTVLNERYFHGNDDKTFNTNLYSIYHKVKITCLTIKCCRTLFKNVHV